MPRRVLVRRAEQSFDLVEVPAENEKALQEVMKSNPQLLPSEDLGVDGDLLVVGRETTLTSGSIDLLCLARSGDLVLVEFKTGPQNPDFRHALAQLIDYGSDLWRTGLEDFDAGVVSRYLKGPHCTPAFKSASTLDQAIDLTSWGLGQEERDQLYARLAVVLATGDFIYVVAAQRFTEGMRSSIEYLNATMSYGRFYLVEIVRLEGSDLVAHSAQVVAAPVKKASGGSSVVGGANETNLLAKVELGDYRNFMQRLLATCDTLGLSLEWGSSGASIRIGTPDRIEPLSIGWVFPPGGGWATARHLTLGYDPSSAQHTPSIQAALDAYVGALSSLPGAKAAGGKLHAYVFEPANAPSVGDQLIGCLDALVKHVQAIVGA